MKQVEKEGNGLDENMIKRINRIVTDYEHTVITHLDNEYQHKTSFGDRLADRTACFGGSWRFIITFGLFLVAWIIWNTLPSTHHFDEAPFILLNLILSLLAGFQAPVIMMSQNRQAERDKKEASIDFAIKYKAEREIDDMQDDLARIESKLSEIKDLRQEIAEIKRMLIANRSS
ncbi:DUF1003 domain-containing protein [Aneurinibacillus sp. Ricciae_BoGa-3]|uniref:DUF1003 domain-containing protein n=1 Tax=Aneurinibacillus sp. Ricciae_BoGa-3 TaxID=3022697 RepID=UPI002341F1B4|nr:DUF1003 domain-containing protein [Aneurinibacillus sp. Ricciae_BoGa-3]WCK53313.1 DUF1003 domain-containing protein [Aneurinibacillus sp. Ricciae_BoGa-3]